MYIETRKSRPWSVVEGSGVIKILTLPWPGNMKIPETGGVYPDIKNSTAIRKSKGLREEKSSASNSTVQSSACHTE